MPILMLIFFVPMDSLGNAQAKNSTLKLSNSIKVLK